MFSWLDNIFTPVPELHTEPEKKEPPEPDDISQYFSTHLQRSRAERQAVLENPFQVTPDDFQMADDYGMDSGGIDNTQQAKSAFRIGRQLLPDKLFFWYVSQSFIGYQACAFIAQHWLVNRACSLKGRDAAKNGFKITFDEGKDVDPKITERIEKLNRRFRLKRELVRADKFKNVFGISHILFRVDSDDPDYYEKPFNPDGIQPGRYKGMTHIDPYWITPLLTTEAVADPESAGFYDPAYWVVAGQKYHRSHFVILRGPEVSDVLKPSYLYGGLPLTQLIMERVYAAERTANEAPQLALTKRLVIRYIDKLEQAIANQGKFEESMLALSEWRDNFGVYVSGTQDRVEQQDTSLSDLDVTIMTQYQIVAGQSGIPATKLMGTSPKGFNATGEHEIKSYHEELESIQENDLEPIVNRHHLCLMRSHIAPSLPDNQPLTIDIVWNPLAVQSAREQAETAELKARTYKTLQDTGAIDEYDIRDTVIADEESGLSGLESVERPEELLELEPPEAPSAGGWATESEDDEQSDQVTQPLEPEEATSSKEPDPVMTGDYVKEDNGRYFVVSEEGAKLSKGYKHKRNAVKRLRQIEYFKHQKDRSK